MTRINRTMIDHYLETLNAYLLLQPYPYTVELAVWSPGDGWTRYQLITADGHTLSSVCTAREIYAVLYAACELFARLNHPSDLSYR